MGNDSPTSSISVHGGREEFRAQTEFLIRNFELTLGWALGMWWECERRDFQEVPLFRTWAGHSCWTDRVNRSAMGLLDLREGLGAESRTSLTREEAAGASRLGLTGWGSLRSR